jgi:hypothetical protein
MSASFDWIIWNDPIGAPNAMRSRAYHTDAHKRTSDAAGLGRNADSTRIQNGHRDHEAVALAAQPVGYRAPIIDELHLARG